MEALRGQVEALVGEVGATVTEVQGLIGGLQASEALQHRHRVATLEELQSVEGAVMDLKVLHSRTARQLLRDLDSLTAALHPALSPPPPLLQNGASSARSSGEGGKEAAPRRVCGSREVMGRLRTLDEASLFALVRRCAAHLYDTLQLAEVVEGLEHEGDPAGAELQAARDALFGEEDPRSRGPEPLSARVEALLWACCQAGEEESLFEHRRDTPALADAMLCLLQALPRPVLSRSALGALLQAMRSHATRDMAARNAALAAVVEAHLEPEADYLELFVQVIWLASSVCKASAQPPHALATVLAPYLLHPAGPDLVVPEELELVALFVRHYDALFEGQVAYVDVTYAIDPDSEHRPALSGSDSPFLQLEQPHHTGRDQPQAQRPATTSGPAAASNLNHWQPEPPASSVSGAQAASSWPVWGEAEPAGTGRPGSVTPPPGGEGSGERSRDRDRGEGYFGKRPGRGSGPGPAGSLSASGATGSSASPEATGSGSGSLSALDLSNLNLSREGGRGGGGGGLTARSMLSVTSESSSSSAPRTARSHKKHMFVV